MKKWGPHSVIPAGLLGRNPVFFQNHVEFEALDSGLRLETVSQYRARRYAFCDLIASMSQSYVL